MSWMPTVKSYRQRLLICMVLFAVIPSLLTGLITNGIARNALEQNAIASNGDMLGRVCTDLDNIFEDTYQIGIVIANDIDIQSILRSNFPTLSQRYSADLRGDTRLNFISSYKKDIYGLYVIGGNGCKHKSRFTSFKDGDFTQEAWYQTIIEADKPVWFGRHEGSFAVETIGDSLISGGFAVIDKASGQKNGVVLYDIAEQRIQNMLQISDLTQVGMMILDADGGLITSSERSAVPTYYPNVIASYHELAGQGTDTSTLVEDRDYLIQCQLSKVTGWLLVAAVPKNDVFQQSSTLGRIIGLLMLGVCAMAVLISWRVSMQMTKPLQTLQAAMKKVRHGDLTICVQTERQDELGNLTRSFNAMVGRIHELLEKSVQDEAKLRRAELAALQSQINPHFLYNTLDAVIWMARKEDMQGVVNIVTTLTRFFRISLSKGKDFIPLADELAHVTSYLVIQKIRYQELLQYEIHVAKECMEILVPKLILQPLVENAIYHGLKLTQEGGEIVIRGAFSQGKLQIEVQDTGIGMLPERLDEVCKDLENPNESANGYGLHNIHARLCICYGLDAGLHLQSEYLMGTTVSFSIPVQEGIQQL